MHTIALIEDHKILVDALEIYLQRGHDLSFAGAAASIHDGKSMLLQAQPDVLLLDVGLPDGDGLDLVPFIKQNCPETKIVVLTCLTDEATLLRAIDKGVNGFLSKSSPLDELMNTVQQAAQGEIVMPTSLLITLLRRVSVDKPVQEKDAPPPWECLTKREVEVLAALARGLTGDEIAGILNIAPLTVRTHIRNIISKMGVHSRLEAVAVGLRTGLITPPA